MQAILELDEDNQDFDLSPRRHGIDADISGNLGTESPPSNSLSPIMLLPPRGFSVPERPEELNEYEDDDDLESDAMETNSLEVSEPRSSDGEHPPLGSLWWDDLTYLLRFGRRQKNDIGSDSRLILNHVFGCIEAGQLCCLVGPSGAGKTTLLSLLTGRRKRTHRVTGQLALDSHEIRPMWIKRYLAFIDQDDVLLSTEKVHEAVEFAANLRLSHQGLTPQQRIQRSDKTIEQLSMHHNRDTIVGDKGVGVSKNGLSGGERKRLAVATQLVAAPRFLVFDEPTSGLDSAVAYRLVCLMRRLSRQPGPHGQKRAVLASLHQPSAAMLQQCDTILVLAQGLICYFGPIDGLVPFLLQRGFSPPPPGIVMADWAVDVVASKPLLMEYPGTVQERMLRCTRAARRLWLEAGRRCPKSGLTRAEQAGITHPDDQLPWTSSTTSEKHGDSETENLLSMIKEQEPPAEEQPMPEPESDDSDSFELGDRRADELREAEQLVAEEDVDLMYGATPNAEGPEAKWLLRDESPVSDLSPVSLPSLSVTPSSPFRLPLRHATEKLGWAMGWRPTVRLQRTDPTIVRIDPAPTPESCVLSPDLMSPSPTPAAEAPAHSTPEQPEDKNEGAPIVPLTLEFAAPLPNSDSINPYRAGVTNGVPGGGWQEQELEEQSKLLKPRPPRPVPRYPSTFMYRHRALQRRMLRTFTRERGQLTQWLAQFLFNGTVALTLWWRLGTTQRDVQNRLGLLFFILLSSSFSGITLGSSTIDRDRPVIWRETDAGAYRPFSYALARLTLDSGILLIMVAVMVNLYYWTSFLKFNPAAYFTHFFTIYFTAFACYNFGLLTGALFLQLGSGTGVAMTVMVVLEVLSGQYILNVPGWWLWVQIIDFVYYAASLLFVTEFTGRVFTCPDVGDCGFPTGESYLNYYGFPRIGIVATYFILIGVGLAFFSLFCFLLSYRRFGTNV